MNKRVVVLLFILFAGFLIYKAFGQVKKRNPESSLVLSNQNQVNLIISKTSTPTVTIKKSKQNNLKDAVNEYLPHKTNSFAVAVKNFKSQESYFLNEHKKFHTGSIYKLWIMATAFEQTKEGLLEENQVLSQKVAVLNNKFRISSDAAEKTTGTISLTVHDAIFQMITYSDNYASLLLSEKVRLSKVASYLQNRGFDESKVGTDGSDPTSTAWDTLQFFEKLYTGNLTDPSYSEKMINILKQQTLNNKLPKYLPAKTEVAHKTGEIYGFSHDAGIVYTPSGDYIIVVFSESAIPSETEEIIANLSRAVYDYFTL